MYITLISPISSLASEGISIPSSLARGKRVSVRSVACQLLSVRLRVYGLLFHLEVTLEMVNTMLDTFADEVASVQVYIDPNTIRHDLAARTARLNALARVFMQSFCGLLA
jgi:hypothetical protein